MPLVVPNTLPMSNHRTPSELISTNVSSTSGPTSENPEVQRRVVASRQQVIGELKRQASASPEGDEGTVHRIARTGSNRRIARHLGYTERVGRFAVGRARSGSTPEKRLVEDERVGKGDSAVRKSTPPIKTAVAFEGTPRRAMPTPTISTIASHLDLLHRSPPLGTRNARTDRISKAIFIAFHRGQLSPLMVWTYRAIGNRSCWRRSITVRNSDTQRTQSPSIDANEMVKFLRRRGFLDGLPAHEKL
jgi:hypothetical protein